MAERPADPDLVDVLEARDELARLDFHTAMPAKVERYDGARQVVDALPVVRSPIPAADGTHTHEALPMVPSVPVLWPRVGAWGLTMALAPGDTGLLVLCETDLGTWRAGDGSVVDPVDLRRHHLSHAVFLPGLATRARALTRAATGTAAVVVGSDTTGARITFKTDGSLEIHQGESTVARVAADGTVHLGASTATSFVALATAVDERLTALQAAFDSHVHATAATGPPVAPTPVPGVIPVGPLTTVAAAKVRAF